MIFVPNYFLVAQNLVSNPSFEDYIQCPDIPGQIDFAIPWVGGGTSVDYYNVCANMSNSYCSVPGVSYRYQYPHSGNAFASIACIYAFNKREYLQIELNTNLSQNKLYFVSAFVNLVNHSRYAISNLGINFSENIFLNPNEDVILLNPSIVPFASIFKDTSNWNLLSGVYKAFGNENYLSIGNFFSDENTLLTVVNPSGGLFSYYNIDDVSVEEITQPFWQYHDTTVYYGDSVLIGPALTGLDIDWYTDNLDFISNAPGIYVTPPTSRDYIAKETFDGVETEHVVHVTVIGGAGLEENELQNVRVFPNPSKGSFSISGLMSDQPLQLEVRDVHGKLVFEEKAFSKELNSFALEVENGIYFVTVSDLESQGFVVEKLVVSR